MHKGQRIQEIVRNSRQPARLRGVFAAGPLAMLTEIYIEARLVDEELPD